MTDHELSLTGGGGLPFQVYDESEYAQPAASRSQNTAAPFSVFVDTDARYRCFFHSYIKAVNFHVLLKGFKVVASL